MKCSITANTHIPAPKIKQLKTTNLILALIQNMYADKKNNQFLNHNKMKKYKIIFQHGESVTVNGKLIIQCEATGQIFIYSENDRTWNNISAIVPASACVVVIG